LNEDHFRKKGVGGHRASEGKGDRGRGHLPKEKKKKKRKKKKGEQYVPGGGRGARIFISGKP